MIIARNIPVLVAVMLFLASLKIQASPEAETFFAMVMRLSRIYMIMMMMRWTLCKCSSKQCSSAQLIDLIKLFYQIFSTMIALSINFQLTQGLFHCTISYWCWWSDSLMRGTAFDRLSSVTIIWRMRWRLLWYMMQCNIFVKTDETLQGYVSFFYKFHTKDKMFRNSFLYFLVDTSVPVL